MTGHGYFEELIMAAVDGEITPEEEAELRAHVDTCQQCRAFWEAMEAVSGVTARDLPPAPEGFAAGVMDAVRAQAPQKKKGKILTLPFRSISLAAIAALALWAGFRIAPAFAAKGASAAAPAQSMMITAAGDAMDSGISADVAEAEEAPPESIQEKYDSLTEAKPQGSLSMNAAETPMEAASAPAPESRAAAEWKLYAGEDLQSEPLLTGDDGDIQMILAPETPCAAPERTADYTVTILEPQEEIWLLWIEDGELIVKNDTRTEAAGTSAGRERLEELLRSAGIK